MLWKSNDKIIIGYDLGNTYSQISYCYVGSENKVETLSAVAGEENFNIPTVLGKRANVNQWLFGKEAVRLSKEVGKECILVDNLVALARDGEEIQLEGVRYQPEALLTLFIKRSMGLLSMVASSEKIEALMITCEHMDARMVTVIQNVVTGLNLKNTKVYMHNHVESFYYYMLYQPKELWANQAMLLEYKESCITIYTMSCNKRTSPVVVYMKEQEYPFIQTMELENGEEISSEKKSYMDRALMEILQTVCTEQRISSAYLIGNKFDGEWMEESLKYICRGRRVFRGNNLFSKGACYGLLGKLNSSEMEKNYVFLGNDKLKANLGLQVQRRGIHSYYALLDAGINWYEAEHSCDLYLQGENAFDIVITPLKGTRIGRYRVILEGISLDKCEAVRIHLRVYLESENTLIIEVKDLGFGEIVPAGGMEWRESIKLQDAES